MGRGSEPSGRGIEPSGISSGGGGGNEGRTECKRIMMLFVFMSCRCIIIDIYR